MPWRFGGVIILGLLFNQAWSFEVSCTKSLKAQTLKLVENYQKGHCRDFERLLACAPENPQLKNNLAVCLFEKGQFKKAEQTLIAALADSPQGQIFQNLTRLQTYLAQKNYAALGLNVPVEEPRLDLLAPGKQQSAHKKTGVKNSCPAKPSAQDFAQVKALFKAWRQAWQKQDALKFLSFYSNRFIPNNGKKPDQWRRYKARVIRSAQFIRVKVEKPLWLGLSEGVIRVRFRQSFENEIFSDQVTKVLTWVKENNHWKIIAEDVLRQ